MCGYCRCSRSVVSQRLVQASQAVECQTMLTALSLLLASMCLASTRHQHKHGQHTADHLEFETRQLEDYRTSSSRSQQRVLMRSLPLLPQRPKESNAHRGEGDTHAKLPHATQGRPQLSRHIYGNRCLKSITRTHKYVHSMLIMHRIQRNTARQHRRVAASKDDTAAGRYESTQSL